MQGSNDEPAVPGAAKRRRVSPYLASSLIMLGAIQNLKYKTSSNVSVARASHERDDPWDLGKRSCQSYLILALSTGDRLANDSARILIGANNWCVLLKLLDQSTTLALRTVLEQMLHYVIPIRVSRGCDCIHEECVGEIRHLLAAAMLEQTLQYATTILMPRRLGNSPFAFLQNLVNHELRGEGIQ
jgi:hypothetical protein